MRVRKVFWIGIGLFLVFVVLILINGFLQNRKLFRAIENNNIQEVQDAITGGAFVNLRRYLLYIPEIGTQNPTPLILACKKGNEEIIDLLLTNGADINRKDNFTNETPLLAALHGSKKNRFSLASKLIEYGADIYALQSNNSVFTETLAVLHDDSAQTIKEGFVLFQYLVKHNVDMTVYSSRTENALTYAAHYNNSNVVEFLIDNNYFDVDCYDTSGSTALIAAAKHGREKMVALLLELGADRTLEDKHGKNAYDYAFENHDESICRLLTTTE